MVHYSYKKKAKHSMFLTFFGFPSLEFGHAIFAKIVILN